MPDREPSQNELRNGHRKRLRERLLDDPTKLFDDELVELLLGYVYLRRDNKMLAKRLIWRFGSIRGILAASPAALRNVEGCGEPTDAVLALLREIMARLSTDAVPRKQPVTLEELIEMGKQRLRFCSHEEVWAALLDKQNRLLNFIRIRDGSADHVGLEPREVAELMFGEKASSIVLMHNHPGGLAKPSISDRDLTERIDTALKSLGMYLQDHLIISSDQCFSLKLDRSIPSR